MVARGEGWKINEIDEGKKFKIYIYIYIYTYILQISLEKLNGECKV